MSERTCDVLKCGRRTAAWGYCDYHYRQWKRLGVAAPAMPKPMDRRSTDVTARDHQGRKFCPYCAKWKATDAFYAQSTTRDGLAHNCRDCHRGAKLLRDYGITLNRYEQLLGEQGGACRICGKANRNGDRLSVDHDHACCPGRKSCGACVRGLLCHACNQGLGKFVDSPLLLRAAAAYLESARG